MIGLSACKLLCGIWIQAVLGTEVQLTVMLFRYSLIMTVEDRCLVGGGEWQSRTSTGPAEMLPLEEARQQFPLSSEVL